MSAEFLILAAALVVDNDFCADRPGLATGTCIVAPGAIQVETSFVEWSQIKTRSKETTEYSIGASRLRIGVAGSTDLHLTFTPFSSSHTRGEHPMSGVGDVSLGIKHRYLTSDRFHFAAMPFVKLPVAKRPLGNGKVEFGLLAPVDIDLTSSWSLTITPEVDWNANADDNGRHARLAIAGSIGFAIAQDWSIAVDGLAGREWDHGVKREAVVGLSLAHQLSRAVQIDGEADFGLTSDVPDLRLIAGFAARF